MPAALPPQPPNPHPHLHQHPRFTDRGVTLSKAEAIVLAVIKQMLFVGTGTASVLAKTTITLLACVSCFVCFKEIRGNKIAKNINEKAYKGDIYDINQREARIKLVKYSKSCCLCSDLNRVFALVFFPDCECIKNFNR